MQTHQALVYEQLHTLADLLLEQTRLLAEDDSDLPPDLQALTCKVDYLAAQLDEIERRARANESGDGDAVCATLDALLILADRLASAPDHILDAAQEQGGAIG